MDLILHLPEQGRRRRVTNDPGAGGVLMKRQGGRERLSESDEGGEESGKTRATETNNQGSQRQRDQANKETERVRE